MLDIASAGPANADPVTARVSQFGMEVFDGDENILVVSAHDPSYTDFLKLFPASINNWKAQGWKDKAIWQFGNVSSAAFVLGLKD
jgi:hypothetical protein